MAAREIRLPAVAGPSMGSRSTCEDFPVSGKSTRPRAGALTRGVSSQKPGRDTSPREATVSPKSCSVAREGAAAAAARCSADVVSNSSTVRAPSAGLGAVVSSVPGRARGLVCPSEDVSDAAGASGRCPKRPDPPQPATNRPTNTIAIVRISAPHTLRPADWSPRAPDTMFIFTALRAPTRAAPRRLITLPCPRSYTALPGDDNSARTLAQFLAHL